LGRYRGEPETVLTCAEEAITLSAESGFAEWLPWGRMGRTESALTMLDAALAHVERSEKTSNLPRCNGSGARCS
jgi:hypothetical protein